MLTVPQAVGLPSIVKTAEDLALLVEQEFELHFGALSEARLESLVDLLKRSEPLPFGLEKYKAGAEAFLQDVAILLQLVERLDLVSKIKIDPQAAALPR